MVRTDPFWERLSRQTDLQEELFPGESLVELLGQNRVLIEGHRGIVEYSKTQITVNVSFGQVVVHGCGLCLRCMRRQQLVICGRIHGITLKRRERQ